MESLWDLPLFLLGFHHFRYEQLYNQVCRLTFYLPSFLIHWQSKNSSFHSRSVPATAQEAEGVKHRNPSLILLPSE